MPCYTLTLVSIDISQAQDQDAMLKAIAKVLNLEVSQVSRWYNRQTKRLTVSPYSPLNNVKTMAKVKVEYGKEVVRKSALARGYKIRPLAENKWEVYR